MAGGETLIQILVILSFCIWAYSKVKRQSLKDTFDEIKNLINSFRENG